MLNLRLLAAAGVASVVVGAGCWLRWPWFEVCGSGGGLLGWLVGQLRAQGSRAELKPVCHSAERSAPSARKPDDT